MTFSEAIGRGQTVGDILADLDDHGKDEATGDHFWSAVRRNLRKHRDSANDRLAERRLNRDIERWEQWALDGE